MTLGIRFCECDAPRYEKEKEKDKNSSWYVCTQCQGVIPCEICWICYDEMMPATENHIDYYVCAEHLGTAIDNVSGRGRT